MVLPGIQGFKNVYEILEAVSAGDKLRLRRAARKICLVLMCADGTCLSEEHRACLTAILSLLVTDWEEAEKLRLEAAQSYLHVRAKAFLCCENAVARVDDQLRHILLEELNSKQKRYMPPGKTLKSIQVHNEREAKQNLQELGLGFRYPLLKMYPERAFDHPASKRKYNGFVQVEDANLLDFLFNGYFEALPEHHKMDALNDFDPDIDDSPVASFFKTQTPTTEFQPKILSSEETERKRIKNKKRNQRKRAAEEIKKKENIAPISAPQAEAKSDPEVKLETSMDLVKISSSSENPSSEDDVLKKVKFVPQPKDKRWMSHPRLNSEACNHFFTQLQEAMFRIPTGNLGRRVYGSQT
ncbi:hypothetical protein QM012_009207 [Aureobasidium pullulans]|uniref:Uncharacterized protein n=1 Tax=Aureobasidium pullulans TaxID=5580 RepID=A0ABR0TG62_AURPU